MKVYKDHYFAGETMADSSAHRDALILRALHETDWWALRVESRLQGQPSGCMTWQRATSDGYGKVSLPGAVAPYLRSGAPPVVRVHRVALVRELNRPLGYGLVVDHLCRERLCARPEHLSEVTRRDNLMAPGSLSPGAEALRARYLD